MKAVLRGKFIAAQAYLKIIDKSQINSLTLHPKELEEQKKKKPKASSRKEILNIRTELNDIGTKSTILRINESKSWFI